MRRSYECDVIGLDNKPIGFAFGSDFTSEHEWGIREMRESFNMDDRAIGFDRSICHKFDGLRVYQMKDELMVLYTPREIRIFDPYKKPDEITQKDFDIMKADYELIIYDSDKSFAAAWDESSFGILAKGKQAMDELRQAVIEPWNDHDAAVFIRRLTKNTRSGLIFMRASAAPQELKNNMRAEHLNYKALQDAKDKTGIEEKLRAAGKEFFALSPRWAKDMNWKKVTAYDVIFWLNPVHQQVDNYGYFTVEELLLWIKGEGPIPMKNNRK